MPDVKGPINTANRDAEKHSEEAQNDAVKRAAIGIQEQALSSEAQSRIQSIKDGLDKTLSNIYKSHNDYVKALVTSIVNPILDDKYVNSALTVLPKEKLKEIQTRFQGVLTPLIDINNQMRNDAKAEIGIKMQAEETKASEMLKSIVEEYTRPKFK